MALLLSLRLTGPEPGHEDAYLGIDIAGFEAADRTESSKLDALISGRTFIYSDSSIKAKFSFKDGTFVLRCIDVNTRYSETLHGSYFFTASSHSSKPLLLLKRSGHHWTMKDQRPSPLSLVQKVLDLNTIMTINYRKNLDTEYRPCMPDKLSLRGYHIFWPAK